MQFFRNFNRNIVMLCYASWFLVYSNFILLGTVWCTVFVMVIRWNSVLKVIVHIQHTLTSNEDELLPCEFANIAENKTISYNHHIQTGMSRQSTTNMIFQSCLTLKPFLTCVAIWLIAILCLLMCLHNSCQLFHTFSHILHLVPVLCLIFLSCTNTQKNS